MRAITIIAGGAGNGRGALGGRKHDIIQQELGAQLMMGGDQHHVVGGIVGGEKVGGKQAIGLVGLPVIPAGQNSRHPHNNVLVVRGNDVALRVHHQRTVRPEAIEANRE